MKCNILNQQISLYNLRNVSLIAEVKIMFVLYCSISKFYELPKTIGFCSLPTKPSYRCGYCVDDLVFGFIFALNIATTMYTFNI